MNGRTAGKRCFIVEGNIGVGKSVFLKLLEQSLDCKIAFEPIAKWQNLEGGNLLEKFYEDTPRWAYTFQSFAFLSRVLEQEQVIATADHDVIIFERSVFSDLHCFAKNCYELGTMTTLEWNLYKEWFTWLVEKHVVVPSGFIYLRANPEICFDRMMHERSRHEEAEIPISYLELLHEKHEDWLVKGKYIAECLVDVPVLSLDRSIDWNANKSEKDRLVEQVASFFKINYIPHVRPQQKSSSLSL